MFVKFFSFSSSSSSVFIVKMCCFFLVVFVCVYFFFIVVGCRSKIVCCCYFCWFLKNTAVVVVFCCCCYLLIFDAEYDDGTLLEQKAFGPLLLFNLQRSFCGRFEDFSNTFLGPGGTLQISKGINFLSHSAAFLWLNWFLLHFRKIL